VIISGQISTQLLIYTMPSPPLRVDVFRPVTFAEHVSKLNSESPDIHCDLDLSNSYYSAKKCTCALLPTITTIINLSVVSGVLLMSSNLVLYTIFLKSLALIKMNSPIKYRHISHPN
jgi:hypothetical protein